MIKAENYLKIFISDKLESMPNAETVVEVLNTCADFIETKRLECHHILVH